VVAALLSGAEPLSVSGGRAGVLVLHGFTGTPASMRPIAEALAAEGLTVELPLLPGHGTAVEDMVPTRWVDWSSAAEAAFEDLRGRSESVSLVGLSMGGTLAAWLAERHPEVQGLVVVNPLIQAPDEAFRGALGQLVDSGTEVAPGIGSDIAMPDAHELSYDGTPLRAVLSLFGGADEVAKDLDRIRCPVLLLSSRQDHVVDPVSGDRLAASVSGPCERVWLERSYHVATLDYDGPEITARTVEFVRRLAGELVTS
jgi:carboxylesterase